MLNKTFTPQVQNELDKRVLFNKIAKGVQDSELKQFEYKYNFDNEKELTLRDYHNWLARTPFIFVYSNTRYPNQSKQQLEHTVLSSQKIRQIKEGEKVWQYDYQQDFFEHYQNSELFGIIPKPVVTELTVEGRQTSNHTLRQVALKIQCYSYEQLMLIRKYFSLPTTSLFIQYGVFTSEQQFKKRFFLPYYGEYDLGKMQNNTYFDQNYVKEKYAGSVTMDYIYGDIYGFDFDQESYDKYVITVKMMTRNLSILLQYINPQQYSIRADELKTTDQQQAQKFSKSIVNVLDQMVSEKDFSDKKEVVIPTNNNAQIYVTYNWVANVVGVLLKFLTLKSYTNTPPESYFFPPLTFIFQSGMDAEVLSFSQNALFFYNDNTKKSINQNNEKQIFETQKIYHKHLQNLFNKSLSIRGLGDNNIQIPDEKNYIEKFERLYEDNKNHHKDSGMGNFSWFGNTYIRYSKVKEIIEGNKQLSVSSLFAQLLDVLNSSTGLAIDFNFSQGFNYVNNYFELSLISQKIYIPQTYRVKNIGAQSIVRQYSTTFNLPDSFKSSMLFSNLSVDDQYKDNVYKNLFRLDKSGRPIDLMQLYSIKDESARKEIKQKSLIETEQTTDRDQQKNPTATIQKAAVSKQYKWSKDFQKIKTTIKTANYLKDSDVKINFDKLKDQNVSKAIAAYNREIVEEFKHRMADKLIGRYSVYKIENQLTLDFISGIHFGQVFTLSFNPMGWDSKFYVNNIKHLIAHDKAETQIFGYMI